MAEQLPETDSEAVESAVHAAAGSPGMAMSYLKHDLAKMDHLPRRIAREGDRDFILRGALSAAVGGQPDRNRQQVLFDRTRSILTDRMTETPKENLANLADAHADLVELAAQAPIYNFDANFLVMEIGGLLASVAGNRSSANV